MTGDLTDVTDEHRPSDTTRRRYLKYAGVAVGGAGIGGYALFGTGDDDADDGSSAATETDGEPMTPDPTATPAEATDETPVEATETESEPDYPYADRFETVVDVAERGGDTDGEEPINAIVEDGLADDTLFYFPEGTYRVADLLVVQHHDNVGFVGPDATLRPTDGQIGDWIIADEVSNLLLEGFSLNNEAEHTGVRTKLNVDGGKNVVRDVEVVGFHDVSTQTHGFTLKVNGADTELRLEDVALTDGAKDGTGIFVHPSNDPGTLRLEDCRIENWYEQGLYGSSHGGPMYIVGGRYANNGTAQVRLGGGGADSEGVVRDVTVRITDPQPAATKRNMRGIWLHEGEGTLVENCTIEVTDVSEYGSSGALIVGPEQGETTIRDTEIHVADSTFALAAASPKDDREDFVIPALDEPPENWNLTVENLTVTGDADDGVGVWIVDRPDCVLRNLKIDQAGTDRHGIGLLRSPKTEIHELSCSTSGYPLLTDVPAESQACLVSLEDVASMESTEYQIKPETERGTASDATRTPSTATGGEYCLDTARLDMTDDESVLGVTHSESEGIRLKQLPDEALNPY